MLSTLNVLTGLVLEYYSVDTLIFPFSDEEMDTENIKNLNRKEITSGRVIRKYHNPQFPRKT